MQQYGETVPMTIDPEPGITPLGDEHHTDLNLYRSLDVDPAQQQQSCFTT